MQNVGLPGGEDGVLLLLGVRGLGTPAGGAAAAVGPPPHVLPQARFYQLLVLLLCAFEAGREKCTTAGRSGGSTYGAKGVRRAALSV